MTEKDIFEEMSSNLIIYQEFIFLINVLKYKQKSKENLKK
jgi:hypothetical protein